MQARVRPGGGRAVTFGVAVAVRVAAGLRDLPHVVERPQFAVANAGFRYEYQMVDVGDFNGRGESVPSPHFIQNLAEAEFVVATFMYMRLLGYPGSRITILTTYTGQKALISDVMRARCLSHPLFGSPALVSGLCTAVGRTV